MNDSSSAVQIESDLFDLTRKSVPLTGPEHLFWLHYRTLEPFIHQHLLQAEAPLLDLGCGSKPYRSLYPKGECIGADVFKGADVDIQIEAGKQLPFEDERFACVFSTQVLEHVYDANLLLSEAFRVTKPGGKLILTVPFVWELHEEPHDFLRFTRYWLEARLKELGYLSVVIVPQGGDIAMIGQSILLVMARRGWHFPRFFQKVFNRVFSRLDRLSNSNNFPLNYGVVAIK
jgi:SAM-dependent methyltransferase